MPLGVSNQRRQLPEVQAGHRARRLRAGLRSSSDGLATGRARPGVAEARIERYAGGRREPGSWSSTPPATAASTPTRPARRARPSPAAPRWPGRPRAAGSRTGTRRSDTLDTDLVYAAVPVASGGLVRGAVRVTYPTGRGRRPRPPLLARPGRCRRGVARRRRPWSASSSPAPSPGRSGRSRTAASDIGEGDLGRRVPEDQRAARGALAGQRLQPHRGPAGGARRQPGGLRRRRLAPAPHAAHRAAPAAGEPAGRRRRRRRPRTSRTPSARPSGWPASSTACWCWPAPTAEPSRWPAPCGSRSAPLARRARAESWRPFADERTVIPRGRRCRRRARPSWPTPTAWPRCSTTSSPTPSTSRRRWAIRRSTVRTATTVDRGLASRPMRHDRVDQRASGLSACRVQRAAGRCRLASVAQRDPTSAAGVPRVERAGVGRLSHRWPSVVQAPSSG